MRQPGDKAEIRRSWKAARRKVADENYRCRVCGSAWQVEACHVVARSLGGSMEADSIIPMCRWHHRVFDGGGLDIRPFLTNSEKAQAAKDAGSEALAERRMMGSALYRREAA